MGVLAPVFLVALGVLGIPILLHLMHRQMPRRVVFPSIRFILKGRDPRQGRRGLRDLLTLLARLALLAVVILLFSQLYLERADVGSTSVGAAEVLLLVDRSASMTSLAYNDYLSDAFTQLRGQYPGARFGMISSAAGVTGDTLALGSPPDAIRRHLRSVAPLPLAGDHQPAIDAAAAMFSDGTGVSRYVYLLSDLQATDWSGVNLTPLDAKADVTVLPPDDGLPMNVGILGVRQERFNLQDTTRLQVTARVRNYGISPVQSTLELSAGERTVQQEVLLRSETTETVVLHMDAPPSQQARLTARTPGDGYALDDEYHFWIGPRPPVQVGVVVDPDNHQQLETFFLQKALNTHQPGFTSYAVTILPPDFMLTGSVRPFQALVFLDSLGNFSELEMSQLKNWVANGGCLIYFAGRQSDAALKNLQDAGISQTRFGGYAGDTDQLRAFSIHSIHAEHPVTAPFRDEPGDLMVFPIYRYCRMQALAQQQVLLTLHGGDPFLIEERLGQGRGYLFAVSAAPLWSDLPTAVSFVPLLREMVDQTLATTSHGVLALTIGEDASARLAARGLQSNRVLPQTPAVVQLDGVPIEINYTRHESDPRRASAVELLARPTISSRGPQLAAVAADARIDRLDPPLAWLLVALVMVELVLANFGLGAHTGKSLGKSPESA